MQPGRTRQEAVKPHLGPVALWPVHLCRGIRRASSAAAEAFRLGSTGPTTSFGVPPPWEGMQRLRLRNGPRCFFVLRHFSS
jgi:hypothetical protein